MTLPHRIFITEVGPRDGLQMETLVLSNEQKLALIAGLVDAGVPGVQVASFVHPRRVPQMADAEGLIERLPSSDKVEYSALTLNLEGVERACRTAIAWIEASISVSESHSLENAGMSVARARQEAVRMIAAGKRAGRKIRSSIQCAFGCTHEMEIPIALLVQTAEMFIAEGSDRLVLADTSGLATPLSVNRVLEALLPIAGDIPLVLHLHDTRGLGLVNVMAAMQMGISHFDTALGGLGGCPFMKGAAGNIATEDTLHLMKVLGIQTGIRISPIALWSRRLSLIFGHVLPGKLYRLSENVQDD
jgi:hydroxymethylglutaryl-CoA lyase